MKRFFMTLIVSVIAMSAFADTFAISASDQQKMTTEAEDWIDDMPQGLQDRLSDAVSHAMQGMYSEAGYFRNFSDTTGLGKYSVIIKNIEGGTKGDITMRLYKPKQTSKTDLPLLIYFHGGGWSLGSINTTERFCRSLVSEGDVAVISVEYPLAPEHPYPVALNTCSDAVNYIIAHTKEFGANKTRVSLGGDGAGGNLALMVYEKLKDKSDIHSLVLYYPMVQSQGSLDPEMKRRYGRGYGFDSRLWEAFVEAYKDPTSGFIDSLPATLLISAGRDIIINEEKTLSSYKNVTYIEFSGALHGFISDGHQPTAFKNAVALTHKFLLEK